MKLTIHPTVTDIIYDEADAGSEIHSNAADVLDKGRETASGTIVEVTGTDVKHLFKAMDDLGDPDQKFGRLYLWIDHAKEDDDPEAEILYKGVLRKVQGYRRKLQTAGGRW